MKINAVPSFNAPVSAPVSAPASAPFHAPNRRRCLQAGIGLAALLAGARPARAATGAVYFGVTPNALVAPLLSALLRELQGRYEHDLGTKVVYKTGNFGNLAMDAVLKAPADGSSVLLASSGTMSASRTLSGDDPAKDFAPIAGIGSFTLTLAIGNTVPAEVKTLKQYVEWVRQSPMQSSVGMLGPDYLNPPLGRWGDVVLRTASYKSMLSVAEDLKFGSLPAAWLGDFTLRAAAAEGHVRLLVTAAEQRVPTMPDVPTLRELGISDLLGHQSFGVYLPVATPVAQQQALRRAVTQALATPALAQALAKSGLQPIDNEAVSYAERMRAEHAMWQTYFQQIRSGAGG